MKTDVETLSPTRVRLTVQVGFTELKPEIDRAYKEIARQVNLPGFRRGKIPPPLVDRYVGRAAVLEQAVNESIPDLYGKAMQESDLQPMGQPEVEVTELKDNDTLSFTAEVDIRPAIEVPDYQGLAVTVDDADVSDADVDEQLQALRDRFGTTVPVERAAETGDVVTIDLVAAADGEPIENAASTGVSYEVGSGRSVAGLDEAVTGLAAGESATFDSELVSGEHAGKAVQITVTVTAVKARTLPELDDDFAQLASEFDTLEELRDDLRRHAVRMRAYNQGIQARDKTLEALLALVEVPLPEAAVTEDVNWRKGNLAEQVQRAGLSMAQYLQGEGKTTEELEAELEAAARSALTQQLVLDALVKAEEIGLTDSELTQHIVNRAMQQNADPDAYAKAVVEGGHLPVIVGEVLRAKALAAVLEAAVVVDESGRPVDLDRIVALAEGRDPDEALVEEIPADGVETPDVATEDAEDAAAEAAEDAPEVAEVPADGVETPEESDTRA